MPKNSKLLIAKDIIKKELSELSGVSMSTLARMRNDVMVYNKRAFKYCISTWMYIR